MLKGTFFTFFFVLSVFLSVEALSMKASSIEKQSDSKIKKPEGISIKSISLSENKPAPDFNTEFDKISINSISLLENKPRSVKKLERESLFLPEAKFRFVKKPEGNSISLLEPRPIKPFPTIYNSEVRRWILFFSDNSDSYLKEWLKKSYRYFPLMKNILYSQGLPKELAVMSAVESSFSAHAISSAHAVGYWQFIRSTGLNFGLRINFWIDERRDFEKSTHAAARYLSKLYYEFDDWLLAMSAYNMGEGRLRRLIKDYNTRNFWVLYKKSKFPRETALYIPKILATAHLLKYPGRYGLTEFTALIPHEYDVFYSPGGLHLQELAVETGLSLKDLKQLNPDLKTGKIPKSIASHPIRIPKGKGALVSHFLDKKKN